MERQVFSCVATIVFLLAVNVDLSDGLNVSQKKKPNLSGIWKLDRSKDNLSKQKRLAPDVILEISHSEPQISIKRKLIQSGREDVREVIYYSDGRGEDSHMLFGDWLGKSITKWQGNKLVTHLLGKLPDNRFRNITFEVYQELKVSADGETLMARQSFRQKNIATTTAGGSSREADIAEELTRNLSQILPTYEDMTVFRRVH